jgi:hypothetical protein
MGRIFARVCRTIRLEKKHPSGENLFPEIRLCFGFLRFPSFLKMMRGISCSALLLTTSARSRRRANILNSLLRSSAAGLSATSARLDTQAFATALLTTTLLVLGYPAAALRKSREYLDAMRRLSEPAFLAGALLREVINHVFLRDSRTALERAEELLAIATEQGMPFLVASAVFNRGWGLAHEGREQGGLAEMSRALPALEGFGATTLIYAQLADSYCKNGRSEEGLMTVATALRETERSGERIFEPELYKVKGELLLTRDPPDEVETERCFRKAIDIARRKKARFFELRATAALPAYSNSGASATRHARCSPMSTTGSPKASTPPISRTPRRCSRNCLTRRRGKKMPA